LHQSVLEGVLGIWWRTTAKDQFGTYQLLQRIIKFVLGHLRDRADQFMR
jgi:hypothetical protein